MLVILTDRLSGIDRQQVEPPSAASREGAERRLDELQAWRQYEANLARLSPENRGARSAGPLDMMVLFFERQKPETLTLLGSYRALWALHRCRNRTEARAWNCQSISFKARCLPRYWVSVVLKVPGRPSISMYVDSQGHENS